jgi:phage FluMu gp28-like protein
MFLPCVIDWINDESPAKLAYKSRRTGWTYGEAFDAVSRRERKTSPRDADYWFSSADESAGQEFIEYCRFWKEDLFGGVADYFTEGYEDPLTKRSATAHVIRCGNGRRITAMTSNPRRFRSKGGDVRLDEFGHHDQPGAMFDAAQPVTLWGGSLGVFGTPNGEEAMLHQLALKCEKILRALGHDPHRAPHVAVPYRTLAAKADELGITPVMSYHRVTIEQAVAQGLVELLNRAKRTNWTREEFIAHLQRQCRNREAYLQEYMCTPGMDLKAALKYHVIEACMHSECPGPVDGFENLDRALAVLAQHYRGGPLFAGVDVGDTHDLTTFWLLEAVGDVLWTRLVYRLRNESMVDQEDAAKRLFERVRLTRCGVLRRGVGVGIHAHLERKYGAARIAGIDESRPVKIGLVTGMVQVFEDRRIRICDHAGIKDSLHSMREARTPGGQVTYEAPRRAAGHADEFSACSAAIDAAAAGGSGISEQQVAHLARAVSGLRRRGGREQRLVHA